MNLAEKMSQKSTRALSKDEKFQLMYQKAIQKIEEVANKGEREICFYDLKGSPKVDWSQEEFYEWRNNCDRLLKQLQTEGFYYMTGSQMGKPMGNWNTPYIVW